MGYPADPLQIVRERDGIPLLEEGYENAQERQLRELSERVDQLSQQVAHVLHEIINLQEGRPYGWRSDLAAMPE